MLELANISAGYGSTSVLRDVSVSVSPASVVALLGPNGAGKTTLLRVASGLLAPRDGTVCLDGADLSGQSAAKVAKHGLCHIPEGRGIFPSLTVQENLVLFAPRRMRSETLERAADAFPVLGTSRRRLAGTLSGGEQKMLALASAYLRLPRFLLLDEVSLGLAPRVVAQIYDFLRELSTTGVAILLVEQYVARALEFADSVYVLANGEVQFAGSPTGLGQNDLAGRYGLTARSADLAPPLAAPEGPCE